ncbi:type VI secretion system-associated protein TagF [Inquilinus sp. YAF38]|uniref:type VI secretion system-associated protein TagF n=1 Tax=Inquilinus sp. YAF38 TaxID=3233084 RepID=UPI003F92861B
MPAGSVSARAVAGPAADRPCGFYGKLPARADFIGAGLRPETVGRWDAWLQQSLAAGEAAIGADWAELFFVAPLWRFILPAGACGRFTLIGVLMPSVDAVGRCFPLMLGQEIERPVDPIGLMAGSGPWFAAAEALALDALGEGFDLAELGRDLPPWSVVHSAAVPQSPPRENGSGTWVELPIASAAPAAVAALAGRGAMWWTTGARHVPPGVAVSAGLVAPDGFAALVDGRWARHGWSVRPPAGGEAKSAEWDRDL